MILSSILFAVLSPAQAQLEVEKQVIASIWNLKQVMWTSDYFDWDDFIQAGKSIIGKAREKYPESVRFEEQLQDLTTGKLNDRTLKIDKQPIRDSLINHYKSLYEANPKSASYAYLYARVLNDPEKGLEFAEKAIKSDGKSYWGYYLKASSLSDLERYDEAEKAYKKAIEIDPGLFDSYYDLAILYYYTKKPDEFVETGIQACKFAPHYLSVQNVSFAAERLSDQVKDKAKLAELQSMSISSMRKDNEGVLNDLMWGAERCYKAFREAGELDSARHYLDLMDAFAGASGQETVLLDRACFEASQGNANNALAIISRMADSGFSAYGYLTDQKEFESLLSDQKMQEVLSRMKENGRKVMKDSLASTSTPAPDFTLVSITGDTVKLSRLRGKVVLLDFWGIGCGPCYQLMPVIERFYQAHKNDLYIYGIESWNNTSEDISLTLSQYGWTYPCLVGSSEVSKLYAVTGVPSMFIMDKKGNIRFTHVGFAPGKGSAEEMYDKLEWLLEELK